MALAVLGILLSLLFALAALRYLAIRPPDQTDRIGARIFFIVIGLPVSFRWSGLDFSKHRRTDACFRLLAEIGACATHLRFTPRKRMCGANRNVR